MCILVFTIKVYLRDLWPAFWLHPQGKSNFTKKAGFNGNLPALCARLCWIICTKVFSVLHAKRILFHGFFYLFKLFLCLLQKHQLWFYVNYLLLLENVSLEEWTEILFHPKTEEWGFVPIIGFSLEEIMIFVLRVLEQISTWKTLFIVNALQNMMLSSCNSVPGWLEINSTIPALCLSISIVNKAFFVSM